MESRQSNTAGPLERSPQSTFSLPPPPPPTIPYGQSGTSRQPFAPGNRSPPGLQFTSNDVITQGAGYNMYPAMAKYNENLQCGATGEALPFTLPHGLSQTKQTAFGFADQSSPKASGFMVPPASMHSVMNQEIHRLPHDPVPESTFAFNMTSPKRGAIVDSGQSANQLRPGSFKRQRLDSSINTDLPYSHANRDQTLTAIGQQQSQYGQLAQHRSIIAHSPISMNPSLPGESLSKLDSFVPDSNVNRPTFTSMAVTENQSLPPNVSYPAQTPNNTHLQQFSPRSSVNPVGHSAQELYRNTPFPQIQSQAPLQIFPYASMMPTVASSMSGNGALPFNTPYSMMQPPPSNVPLIDQSGHASTGVTNSGFTLVMRQQPERARLCSFKEENDTIDRRPVDPPPIVEILSNRGDSVSEILVRHNFFMKAMLVAQNPEFVLNPSESSPSRKHVPVYPELRLPAGQEATTGEVTQTPDKLLDLEGKEGAFCVFGRLSIRMPGQFRLRFVLYETTPFGVQDMGFVLSNKFEGLKIKLRQDGTSRNGRRKKAQPEDLGPSSRKFTAEAAANDKKQRKNSITGPAGDKLISPKNPLTARFAAETQISATAQRPQPIFSSIPTTGVNLDPAYRTGVGTFAPRYSLSSSDSQNVSNRVPSFTDFTQQHPKESRPLLSLEKEMPLNNTSEETLSTIEYSLDLSPNEKCDSGFSLVTDVDMTATASEAAPKLVPSTRNNTALPSISRAMQKSSVWLENSRLVPPDEMVHGGVLFRKGIRYGGDDGFMPPMSFGKLPGLINEGIFPCTPGLPSGTDLSNFSLKNRLANPSLIPYSMMPTSAPTTPNNNLTHYLNNNTLPGSSFSAKTETSKGINSNSYHNNKLSANQRNSRIHSNDAIKPSQFADLEDKPDAAAVHGVEGFSAALSSSLEDKVRSFNLALPRRASRGSRGSLEFQLQSLHSGTPQNNRLIPKPVG